MRGSANHSPITGMWPRRWSASAVAVIASTLAWIRAGSPSVPDRYGPATRIISEPLIDEAPAGVGSAPDAANDGRRPGKSTFHACSASNNERAWIHPPSGAPNASNDERPSVQPMFAASGAGSRRTEAGTRALTGLEELDPARHAGPRRTGAAAPSTL